MRVAIYAIIALVAVQRLIEIRYAERNTAALLARGAIEVGRRHYPLIVLLHASWLVAMVLALPFPPRIFWLCLSAVLALQAARVWVIASLGPYWTTRIITLDTAPLVRRGPYRFVRHPSYLIVALEIAALPLAFGEFWVALIFSLANVAILSWRIRQEDQALSSRRSLSPMAAAARDR
jgi:methyltransferase